METVTTDDNAYAPGSLVHVSGTGYTVACDVVVKVTRPDGLVVVGDGSQVAGSDTVSTDLFGNFTYDYQLQSVPAVEGTYVVDVLGAADAVLAHTTFEDAVTIAKLYLGSIAPANEDYLYTTGNTVVADASVDGNGNPANQRFYKFFILDGSGIVRNSPTCTSNGAGGPVVLSYTMQAADPASNANAYTFRLKQYAGTAAAALASCNADTSGGGASERSDQMSFFVVKATSYSNSSLSTPSSSFAAGATAYVTFAGLEQNKNDYSTSWILPSNSTACQNTGASDRFDAAANGTGPQSQAAPDNEAFLQYQPNAGATGASWNRQTNYDGVTCPAFASGNQGQWKLTLQTDIKHFVTLNVFSVDTTPPTVTINQAGTQVDPTTASTIHYTAVFSEPVTGFTGSDVSFTGSTSGGTKSAAVSQIAPNDGTTYDVAVTGMTSRGTVVASIPAGSAQDAATNSNTASSSTDNTVTWDRVPSTTQPSFSPASPKTNDSLQASTTTSDPDGDNVSVGWVWKVNRAGDICTIQTNSSASAAPGVRTASLDLSANYVPTSCTGSMINPLNPSKGDSVIVEATPNDGLFDGTMQSNNVTIANTAPTLTLSAGNDTTVTEGSIHTYSYTISDPDGDTITVVTSCGANGTKTNASNTNTSGSFDCTFPDGLASSTVSAQATDSGFGAATGNNATQPVTINNVPPSIAISGNANVDEGSAYSLTLGAITDPGTDTVTSWIVHWGDGNSRYLRQRRRQEPHLRRRSERLQRDGRPGRRGRNLPRPRQRALGAREQRRPDSHLHDRAGHRQRGRRPRPTPTRSPIRARSTPSRSMRPTRSAACTARSPARRP